MKFTRMTTLVLVASTLSQGAAQPPERHVTVCIEGSAASASTLGSAKSLASKIFARIGVKLDWRNGLSGCSQCILISLIDNTPPSLLPGKLAYALPYEGVHIRLFYDRIAHRQDRFLVQHVLAHVLVHEITHILQGISRHSHQGIMKDRWEQADFDRMILKPLEFAQDDIELIRRGLAARAGRCWR